MKHLRTVGIVSMLMIFPGISWYYLSSGFEYRKASYERLQPKDIWSESEFDLLQSIGEIKGKTTVVFDDQVSQDFLNKFYDQYKDAYTFQMVVAKDLPSDFPSQGNVKSLDTLSILTKNIILIDTAQNVRNYYNHTRESLTLLIEDVAMTIPRKPSIDIISQ